MGFSYLHRSLFNASVPVIRENGGYDVLEHEVFAIQTYFHDIKDDFDTTIEEKTMIVGHFGLGGEFGNGIGPAIKNYIRQLEPVIVKENAVILNENADLLYKAFNHFAASFYEKQSQRAKYAESDPVVADEKAGPALQRSLLEIGRWVMSKRENLDHLPDDRRVIVSNVLDDIAHSLIKCDAALEQIEAFASATSIYAASHQTPVRPLEREEIRALFMLNKTIAAKLNS